MLQVNNLNVSYGKVPALKSISLEVRHGEIVTMLGANGAGKTTTLKSISGLLKPLVGTVQFLGRRIENLPSTAIVGMGISHIPEGRMIFPEMTAMENLEMGAYLVRDRGIAAKKCEEVFDYFPILRERKNQLAGTLSGGEQQMLAIGRGLMSSPKLLLLDEPSLGLAPLLVEKVFEILKQVREIEEIAILLVEQNAELAMGFASRGYVIETGEIVLQGPTSALQADNRVKEAYLGL